MFPQWRGRRKSDSANHRSDRGCERNLGRFAMEHAEVEREDAEGATLTRSNPRDCAPPGSPAGPGAGCDLKRVANVRGSRSRATLAVRKIDVAIRVWSPWFRAPRCCGHILGRSESAACVTLVALRAQGAAVVSAEGGEALSAVCGSSSKISFSQPEREPAWIEG
jgi:hypothetical protein